MSSLHTEAGLIADLNKRIAELELESEAHQFRVKLAQTKMIEVKQLFEKFMDGDGGLTDLGNAIDDLLPPSEESSDE